MFVREGYRTQEEQQQLLDEKIEAYENERKSKSEAKKLVEQWVAISGTSEHQLGISVDINADTTKSSSDDANQNTKRHRIDEFSFILSKV